MLTGWISWGLGLIFGAILAREMGKHAAKNGMPAHYPLLAVAGYMGMSLTWGWGLSSSAGLLQATDGNALMLMGFVDRVIPSTEWVFHPYPLTLTALSLVYGSVMLYLLSPPEENCRPIGMYVDLDDEGAEPETAPVEHADRTGATKPLGRHQARASRQDRQQQGPRWGARADRRHPLLEGVLHPGSRCVGPEQFQLRVLDDRHAAVRQPDQVPTRVLRFRSGECGSGLALPRSMPGSSAS